MKVRFGAHAAALYGWDSVDSRLRQTHLTRQSSEVAGDLQRRLTRGRELLTELTRSRLPVPERLEHFGARYWDWHDDCAAFLERAFSTSEIEQSYAQVAIERGGDPAGIADLLRDLALGLQRDISFLVRLHSGLRAYDASARPPTL